MNITINQITNQQETVPSTVLIKILTVKRNGGVVNLTGIGDISAGCFSGCTSLNYLVCPKGQYWGSEDGFSGCSALNKIQINDLTSWYTNGSNRYDNGFPLTCNNLVKQLYDSNGNYSSNSRRIWMDANNIPYCFVPDASLSAYQSSSAWSSLNLHGMSEFSSLATQNNWDLPTT